MSDRASHPDRKARSRWPWVGGLIVLLMCPWLVAPLLSLLPLVSLPPALVNPSPESLEWTDRHGNPLRVLLTTDDHRAQAFRLDQVPPHFIQATLAAEDKRFWDHGGVDVLATIRATADMILQGRVVSGASTLTQQLIKVTARQPRTLTTKVSESLQAIRLEQQWDKRRILSEYLQRVEYGGLSAGCEAAARHYFDKSVRELSLAEAALLAGLPQAPSFLNPHHHPDHALARRQVVLDRMLANGWIRTDQHHRASNTPLNLADPRGEFHAPHFVDWMLQLHPDLVRAGGIIRTTLDLSLQRQVEDILNEHLEQLKDFRVRDGAVVIMDNRDGSILTMVGGRDWFAPDSGQVNAALAPRSPGSALKPFTALLALEKGMGPWTVFADVPTEYPTPTGVFRPVNYDRRTRGPVRMRLALANSLNIASIHMLDRSGGAAALQDLLQQCGLTTLDREAEHYGLGLTIGNAEVRLVELVRAYAAIANEGALTPWRTLADQAVPPPGDRIADPASCYLLADILADPHARASSFGFDSPLHFPFPVATKTGTSSDFRDNWTVGFTPEFTVGVWVGNVDGSPMTGTSGITGAGPIFRDIFLLLEREQGLTWFDRPETVREVSVHPLLGVRLEPDHPEAVTELAHEASLPRAAVESDFDGQGRALLPARYQSWMASGEHNLQGRATISPPGPEEWAILSPQPNTRYYLDPDLPANGARLKLSSDLPGVHWSSPSLRIIDESGQPFAILTPGEHVLLAIHPEGVTQRRTRVVVETL